MADNETPLQETQPAENVELGAQTTGTISIDALKERLAQKERSVLKQLGVENIAQAKSALEDAAKLKQANLTETERAIALLTAAQKERDEAQAQLVRLENERKADKVRMAIKDAATEARAHNPAAILALLQTDSEFEALVGGETPNTKQIAAKIEALKKSDSYLFSNGAQGSPSNRAGITPGGEALPALSESELQTALRFNMTPLQYAQSKVKGFIVKNTTDKP